MLSVLFVCTANMCRSPMAEALFFGHLKHMGLDLEQWKVASAGTWTEDGCPASVNSVEVMKERGMDISGHKSRVVTADLLAQFNLILVMESNHKEALCFEFPSLAERIFLLSEMAGRKKSIQDPIGQDIDAYRKCADEMQNFIEQGWEKILRLA